MLAFLAQIDSDDEATFEALSLGSNIFSLILLAVSLGAAIFMLVDLNRRPDWAWNASGQQKGLWLGLGVFSILMACCCGLVSLAIVAIYWFAIRPKLEEAQRRGPGGFGGPPGGFGGPPGGFGGPPGGYPGGPPGGFQGGPPGGTSGSPGWGPPPPPPAPPPPPPPLPPQPGDGGSWGPPS